MALHLLQTALGGDGLSGDALRRNLYAILTVSDQFVPDADLKAIADAILSGHENGMIKRRQ